MLLFYFQHHLRHARHKRQQWNTTFSSSGIIPEYQVYLENNSPESGEWSPWSEGSQCSRSCGGGVAYQTRRCLTSRYLYEFISYLLQFSHNTLDSCICYFIFQIKGLVNCFFLFNTFACTILNIIYSQTHSVSHFCICKN